MTAAADSLSAISDGPAAAKIDLLSALMHELGHVAGLDHDTLDDLMADTLAPGIRRTVTSAEVDRILANESWN